MKITKANVLRLYRRGIHSATKIARKLGHKTREQRFLVRRILIAARIPIRRRWTETEREQVRLLYPDISAAAIAKGLIRTVSGVYREAHKLEVHPRSLRGGFEKGIHAWPAGEFKKGRQTWNKGMKGLSFPGCERTQFKKGHLPATTLYDGAVTIRTDWNGRHDYRQYKWIRMAKAKWGMLHVFVWEHFCGPVPSGHIVVFANGDTMNCRLDNLRCISRMQHAAETRMKDQYIAKCLSHVCGQGKGQYDHDLYLHVLGDKSLIEAKRRQLALRRAIREQVHG